MSNYHKGEERVPVKNDKKRKNGKEASFKNPYAAGRPQHPITWSIIDDLIARQCTLEEIAATVHISPDVIERKVKKKYNMKFAEYYKIKRQIGFASLRSTQYKLAMAGNPTMLVWLGKNWLNQTDKFNVSADVSTTLEIKFVGGDNATDADSPDV